MSALPRVLIVDDHRVVAEGIAELLGVQYTVLPIVTDGALVPALVMKEQPDILLTDITMPNVSGLEAYRQIRRLGVDIPTVILTMHAQAAMVDEALSIGIRGYVLKTAAGEELLLAMKEVLRGGTFVSPSLWPRTAEKPRPSDLTPRQREVLNLLAGGLRSREIANKLNLSVRTVEAHRQALMQAFQVRNSVELVNAATRLGLITPND